MNARPISLIVNPASGNGKALRRLPIVEEVLRRRGCETRTLQTQNLEHGLELAEGAASRGDVVAVMGGDGIIHSVLPAVVAHSDACLAIIPAGTGNDFARSLGIRSEGDGIAALLTGEPRRIDLGCAGGKYFSCIASVGFDSDVIEAAKKTRLIKGPLVYPYATIKALLGWKPARFEVVIDGQEQTFEGYSVAVANSGYYGGGMWLAPGADHADGVFQVVMISHVSRPRFLAQALKVFSGAHVNSPQVSTSLAKQVRVAVDRDLAVYADGELVGKSPIDMDVVAGAIQILLPTAR